MPSVNAMECRIEELLSKPWYSSMFIYLNEFRTPSFDRRSRQAANVAYSPATVARATARAIVENKMLRDPVEIGEVDGPFELYRAHDGNSTSRSSAGTLGRCWFSRQLIENLWLSTAGASNRKSDFIELVRACNLVLVEWNAMTQMAGMRVPDGCRLVVVTGEGSWAAMFPRATARAGTLPPGLTRQLSRMSTEPTTQYVVPIFNPNWVQPVVDTMTSWPLMN